MGRLKRLAGEREKLVAEHGKAKISQDPPRPHREAPRGDQAGHPSECLLETQIGAKHVDDIVEKLKEAHRLIDVEQHTIRQLESASAIPPPRS